MLTIDIQICICMLYYSFMCKLPYLRHLVTVHAGQFSFSTENPIYIGISVLYSNNIFVLLFIMPYGNALLYSAL